jgi:hypothetical protein
MDPEKKKTDSLIATRAAKLYLETTDYFPRIIKMKRAAR